MCSIKSFWFCFFCCQPCLRRPRRLLQRVDILIMSCVHGVAVWLGLMGCATLRGRLEKQKHECTRALLLARDSCLTSLCAVYCWLFDALYVLLPLRWGSSVVQWCVTAGAIFCAVATHTFSRFLLYFVFCTIQSEVNQAPRVIYYCSECE